jgi:outer membrane protein TolC
VRDAASRLEQNQQRIETTRLGRELAEQRLDAEQRRFEVGLSTSFLVIQAQRDLAVARNSETQALLDYQLSNVTFETVQQSGGGNGAAQFQQQQQQQQSQQQQQQQQQQQAVPPSVQQQNAIIR